MGDVGMGLAAIIQQVGQKCADVGRVDGVEHMSAFPPRADNPGLLQKRQMKGKPGRGYIKRPRDIALRHTFRPRVKQQTHQCEPCFMRQGRKCAQR